MVSMKGNAIAEVKIMIKKSEMYNEGYLEGFSDGYELRYRIRRQILQEHGLRQCHSGQGAALIASKKGDYCFFDSFSRRLCI